MKREKRPSNMTDAELFDWMLSQTEKAPCPYPDLAPGPCMIWTKGKSDGYGIVGYKDRPYHAHRLIKVLLGEVGAYDGVKVVTHKCAVRPCINPDHLAVSDFEENTFDKGKRGTYNIIPKSDREKMIEMVKNGVTRPAVAEAFGVSRQAVWRHTRGIDLPQGS